MQSICFSKYARVVLLEDKREITIVNTFQKILDSWWWHQSGEFYNKLFNRFLKINKIEMYSTYNEGKSVVAERFIRTLKNKIFKHMTAISKTVYFDVLDDIVNKYNNTVHRTIKIKPIDVTSDSYAEYNEDFNKPCPNLKLVITSEFQNTKTFLLKDALKIGQKKFLLLAESGIVFRGHTRLVN